jgi:hypothetical protein
MSNAERGTCEETMALTLKELESELRRQPPEVQAYLAEVLLDALDVDDTDEDADEAEVHRRAMEMERGRWKRSIVRSRSPR